MNFENTMRKSVKQIKVSDKGFNKMVFATDKKRYQNNLLTISECIYIKLLLN